MLWGCGVPVQGVGWPDGVETALIFWKRNSSHWRPLPSLRGRNNFTLGELPARVKV